jgi:hypothetical protein
MTDMAVITYRSPFDVKPAEFYESLEEIAEQEHLFSGVTAHLPCGLDGTAAWFYPAKIRVALARQNIKPDDQQAAIDWLVRNNYLGEHKEQEWQTKKKYITCYYPTHKGLAEYHQYKLHI